MNDDTAVSHPILKVASVVAVTIGGLTWGEIAQIMASIYTLCLITEWIWKKLVKPLAIHRGWLHGKRRPFLESTDRADL